MSDDFEQYWERHGDGTDQPYWAAKAAWDARGTEIERELKEADDESEEWSARVVVMRRTLARVTEERDRLREWWTGALSVPAETSLAELATRTSNLMGAEARLAEVTAERDCLRKRCEDEAAFRRDALSWRAEAEARAERAEHDATTNLLVIRDALRGAGAYVPEDPTAETLAGIVLDSLDARWDAAIEAAAKLADGVAQHHADTAAASTAPGADGVQRVAETTARHIATRLRALAHKPEGSEAPPEDRSEPPPGYIVQGRTDAGQEPELEWYWGVDFCSTAPYLATTHTDAVAHCWAHRNAVLASARPVGSDE